MIPSLRNNPDYEAWKQKRSTHNREFNRVYSGLFLRLQNVIGSLKLIRQRAMTLQPDLAFPWQTLSKEISGAAIVLGSMQAELKHIHNRQKLRATELADEFENIHQAIYGLPNTMPLCNSDTPPDRVDRAIARAEENLKDLSELFKLLSVGRELMESNQTELNETKKRLQAAEALVEIMKGDIARDKELAN